MLQPQLFSVQHNLILQVSVLKNVSTKYSKNDNFVKAMCFVTIIKTGDLLYLLLPILPQS